MFDLDDSNQPKNRIYPNLRVDGNLIRQLEEKFAELNTLLYTTSVPNEQLEEKVLPYIADDVVFRDPWQEGGNKHLYSIGMKGFHNMFHFTFDTHQIGVHLDQNGLTGRCIVDGIMHLKQFSWIYTFPLRTIVVYNFRLLDTSLSSAGGPKFEIYKQEEMWSFLELIEGIPGIGFFYRRIFRPTFGHLFVGVSYLSCVAKDCINGAQQKWQQLKTL